jgi:hypothetical protein
LKPATSTGAPGAWKPAGQGGFFPVALPGSAGFWSCVLQPRVAARIIKASVAAGFSAGTDQQLKKRDVHSVPQRIKDFLVQHQGRMHCDTCIQEQLGLRWRNQVQIITATLAQTGSFGRDVGECCTCRKVRQVSGSVMK